MPTVETSLGTIVGRERGGIEQYLGIRYAQPPVGELRWRAAASAGVSPVTREPPDVRGGARVP